MEKQKRKRTKGSTKGSAFERSMCRRLSLWITNNERDDVLWRNRTRCTTKTPNAESQLGDVIATDPIAEFFPSFWNIELKRGYGRWSPLDVLDGKGKKTVLGSVWGQTLRDAELSGRKPLLIFRRDQCKEMVVFRKGDVDLGLTGDTTAPVLALLMEGEALIFMALHHFVDWLDPAVVRRMNDETNAKKKGRTKDGKADGCTRENANNDEPGLGGRREAGGKRKQGSRDQGPQSDATAQEGRAEHPRAGDGSQGGDVTQ